MTGDFSRDSFDHTKHYLRVLMQQGRVLLDADWNEQAAILLHFLQTLAADLIGPHGGPGNSFKIITDDNVPRDFKLHKGHYYVNGRLCENETNTAYTAQTEYPSSEELENGTNYLVYLDVWERHVTWIEDEDVRERALNGSDTATRSKLVWQAKTQSTLLTKRSEITPEAWKGLVEAWQPKNRGSLSAQTEDPSSPAARAARKTVDACVITPEARYRGPENQLYRIEIHKGGATQVAKFKWSRDNAAVIFPIRTLTGNTAVLENLGRDHQLTLQKDDWVEIMDSRLAKRGEAGPLLQIESIDLVENTITLVVPEDEELSVYEDNDHRHPYLRRWESGPMTIQEDTWLSLEAGIQIYFNMAREDGGTTTGASNHHYRTGDYWLIPARVSEHDILWPKNQTGTPQSQPPHGVRHYYAPLAIIAVDAAGKVSVASDADCRCILPRPCPNAVGELPPDHEDFTVSAALAPAVAVKPKAKPRAGKKAGG